MKLSDLILVYDYKEPLTKIPDSLGFGYYGTISGTQDKTKIQCHVCGLLFKSLFFHILSHDMTTTEYKERYGLAYQTTLTSPQFKEEKRQRYLQIFNATKRKTMRQKGQVQANKNPNFAKGRTLSLETKNKRGSCPDQILAKIQEATTTLGHTPSLLEFQREEYGQRYWALIKRTFKTWNNALKIANLKPKNPKHHTQGSKRYSKEELLENIRIFKQETNRAPTYSDFGTEMLPAYTTYQSHFKTLDNARTLAGIYN